MTTSDFKYNRYDEAVLEDVFNAATDGLANNQKLIVSFQHVPTEKEVYFKAFVTTFNESYNCDWTPELVYGRGDPIYQFKNTTRKITLAFKVPASSDGEAYENLGRVQKLIQFLYPRYSEINSATTISQAPLVRMKVMNIFRNVNDTFAAQDKLYEESPTISIDVDSSGDKYDNYKSLQNYEAHDGVLGVIDSCQVVHSIAGESEGAFVVASSAILPRVLDITVNFSAIHEHTMGWNETDAFGASDEKCVDKHGKTVTCSSSKALADSYQTRLFPYGVHLDGDPTSTSAINSEGVSADGSGTDGDAVPADGVAEATESPGDDQEAADAAGELNSVIGTADDIDYLFDEGEGTGAEYGGELTAEEIESEFTAGGTFGDL